MKVAAEEIEIGGSSVGEDPEDDAVERRSTLPVVRVRLEHDLDVRLATHEPERPASHGMSRELPGEQCGVGPA